VGLEAIDYLSTEGVKVDGTPPLHLGTDNKLGAIRDFGIEEPPLIGEVESSARAGIEIVTDATTDSLREPRIETATSKAGEGRTEITPLRSNILELVSNTRLDVFDLV